MADNLFTFDDDDFGFSGFNYTASSPLCVPQDPIDEIELYPNFLDDSISLSGLDFSLESETSCGNEHNARVMMRQRVALQDCSNGFLSKKKQRRKTEGMNEVEKHWQRKCSHCETTQTPQWRMGSLGPKTLCNACGVRYKSGRLLPEYRPAASPTFDSHLHSNFHRKILKKKKNGLMG